MASKNRHILKVNGNRIVLLNDLIPKDVTMFEYECKEDGRIVLTPFQEPSGARRQGEKQNPHKKQQDKSGQVFDFRTGQALRERRSGKARGKMTQRQPESGPHHDEQFVRLHHFPSRMEAEMVGEILKQAEIPFLIQSEDIGIFGPSAAPAPGGAWLVVRKADLPAAKHLLIGLI